MGEAGFVNGVGCGRDSSIMILLSLPHPTPFQTLKLSIPTPYPLSSICTLSVPHTSYPSALLSNPNTIHPFPQSHRIQKEYVKEATPILSRWFMTQHI